MANNSVKPVFNCELSLLLELKNWSVDEAADALGDSALRLHRVLDGEEALGRTARLAIIALMHNLEPIEK